MAGKYLLFFLKLNPVLLSRVEAQFWNNLVSTGVVLVHFISPYMVHKSFLNFQYKKNFICPDFSSVYM